MFRITATRTCATALLAFVCAGAAAQRVPISSGDDKFSAAALVQGVVASRNECETIAGAVWADAGTFGAECIRYWAAGLPADGVSPKVLVYLPPDQLAGDATAPGYTSLSPSSVASLVVQMQRKIDVPLILLSRPGTFGSSGFHKDRRREAEARLMSAALDAVKSRHGVREFVVAGLSGGGHTVAALLGWRPDITCAVAASAVSSPRLRWKLRGLTADLTGHSDSYEPVEHLKRESFHPGLRVFVLGDLKDSNVIWATQVPLATRLKELGVAVETLNAEGSDSQHHALSDSSRAIGALCMRGASTPEIIGFAAKGL